MAINLLWSGLALALALALLMPGGAALAQSAPALANARTPPPTTTPWPIVPPSPSLQPPPNAPVVLPSPPVEPPPSQPFKVVEIKREVVPQAPALPAIQPVAAQVGGKGGQPGGDKSVPYVKGGFDGTEFRNLYQVPSIEVLTRLESQDALEQRMIQENLRRDERIVFPVEPVLSKVPYAGRHWEPLTKLVEPNFVCHKRLLFEQQNLERSAWDLSVLTPVVSAGKFYWDVVLLPYHLGTRPCQQYDCSAGKCMPGDPAPLLLYPVELSLSGLAAEAAVVTGAFFVFP